MLSVCVSLCMCARASHGAVVVIESVHGVINSEHGLAGAQ